MTIPKHVQIIQENPPVEMDVLIETPYTSCLFQVRADGGEILTYQEEVFLMPVANILLMSFRSCPDLKTPISFLITRTK